MDLFEDKLLTKPARANHRLIGQLFDTYWLVEFENQFYIIDQHAAHEKVNYERFVKRFKETNYRIPVLKSASCSNLEYGGTGAAEGKRRVLQAIRF